MPFNPEGLKIIYEEFAQAAGVDIRYFTRVIDVQLDPANDHRIDGVIISNVDGYSYIKAKAFVDCTGDAILAGLCGAKCREAYKDTPKGLAASLDSLWAGCDWEIAGQRVDEFKDLLDKAVGEGRFTQSDRLFRGTVKGSAVGIARLGKTTALLNAGHIYNMNALRNKDVTEAMIFGRRQLLEYWDFMRKDLPGMSGIDMIATGSLLGVRESRRIVGEYEITQEDFFEKRHFPDQIGAYNRMMDIHPYDDSPEELEKFRRNMERNQLGVGNYLGIPYGILVPKGWHNLWVAGRCVSTDPQVLGTLRAQPCCAIMGQAAGTAAVQAVRTGALAYRLDTDLLRDTLRNNGAYIPE